MTAPDAGLATTWLATFTVKGDPDSYEQWIEDSSVTEHLVWVTETLGPVSSYSVSLLVAPMHEDLTP